MLAMKLKLDVAFPSSEELQRTRIVRRVAKDKVAQVPQSMNRPGWMMARDDREERACRKLLREEG